MRIGRLGHLVFALGYCAVAAVTALLLGVFRPQTDPVVIILAAVQVVLAGGLVHETVIRRFQHRKITERLARMRQAYEDLVDLILKTRVGATPPPNEMASAPASAGATDAAVPEPVPNDPPANEAAASEPALAARRPPARLPARPAPTVAPTPAPLPTPAPALPLSPPNGDEAKLVADVREALAERRVEAFLHPIVILPGRKPRGFEVLARLRTADGVLITPDRFLPVVEQERLLPALDLLMLARVTQLIRDTDRHRHAVSFFCNLALPTLADPTFMAEYLGGGGDRHGVRDKLVFELSQRIFGAATATPLSTVGELAQVGFRFAMDGVGQLDIDPAGLAGLGLRYLKLSYPLLAAAERRGELAEFRRRLSGAAIDLIVEKVETEAQAHDVEQLGLDSAQGFLFGEPRPSKRPGS